MLRSEDAEYLKAKAQEEGLDYAVNNFSGTIEDYGYRQRLEAYQRARRALAAYIGVEP